MYRKEAKQMVTGQISGMLHFFLPILAALFLSLPAIAQGWLELPRSAEKGDDPSCRTLTQYMKQGDRIIRSHTYHYDETLRLSHWVAYPLNAGLIGQGSRGDGWHPFASLDEAAQPILYRGFGYKGKYDRGHQIPSADRLEAKANAETFVFINATPQDHDFNAGVWTDLERLVRSWAKRSDTLYVVTGIIPGNEWVKDNAGNPMNVPEAYYKTVLRRNTGKDGITRWSVCSILLPHTTKSFPEDNWPQRIKYLRIYSLTTEKLERLTSESFFPNLERIIGHKEYETLKKSDPREEEWWWK